MRPNLLLAGALALALTGAACSGCAVLDPTKGALSQTVVDEKALYAAEAALFGANSAAEAAVDQGLVIAGSPTALKVADVLDQAHDALQAARAAYKVGDAKGYGEKIAALQGFVASAWTLIPGKKEA